MTFVRCCIALRDFRGDTLHPSTLQVMHELGLLPELLRLAHIGDAAHAMSPVGGVGINLAVQDAVAAARLLAAPLREGRLSEADLRRVQRRRELPTRITQRIQLLVQNRVIKRVLGTTQALSPPMALRLFARLLWLRRIPARLIGLGIRPEHVA